MRIYRGDVRDGYFAKSLSEYGADNARTDLNSVLVIDAVTCTNRDIQ
jgi:hypothetical protein